MRLAAAIAEFGSLGSTTRMENLIITVTLFGEDSSFGSRRTFRDAVNAAHRARYTLQRLRRHMDQPWPSSAILISADGASKHCVRSECVTGRLSCPTPEHLRRCKEKVWRTKRPKPWSLTRRCSEPGGRVAVAIVASRAPGLPPLRDWVVRPLHTR
jgi:hypothetical protein